MIRWRGAIWFVGLILATLIGGPLGRAGEKTSAWLTDYDQACQLARTTGKPLFVVFRCEY